MSAAALSGQSSTDEPRSALVEPRGGPGTASQVGVVNGVVLRVIARAARARHAPAVFSTLARNRRLFRRWLPFATALMPRGSLPRADTELVILRVAHNCQSEYEAHHHRAIGIEAGLSIEQVAAVPCGAGAACFSARQNLLLRATDELHAERAISQEVWARLAEELSEPDLIEYCMLVGHYEMIAMTLNSLGVQPEMDSGGLSLMGATARFSGGLRDLGSGTYAWLQPNGEVGESNAGLVVGDGESVLIDTLWDLRLTRRLLAAAAEPTRDAPITMLINTHGDGDHCWGNQLLRGAEIVAVERRRKTCSRRTRGSCA